LDILKLNKLFLILGLRCFHKGSNLF